jgi:hypothetical protein
VLGEALRVRVVLCVPLEYPGRATLTVTRSCSGHSLPSLVAYSSQGGGIVLAIAMESVLANENLDTDSRAGAA